VPNWPLLRHPIKTGCFGRFSRPRQGAWPFTRTVGVVDYSGEGKGANCYTVGFLLRFPLGLSKMAMIPSQDCRRKPQGHQSQNRPGVAVHVSPALGKAILNCSSTNSLVWVWVAGAERHTAVQPQRRLEQFPVTEASSI